MKPTEARGPRGLDAGKKVKGRKRRIPTDTMGWQDKVIFSSNFPVITFERMRP